MEIMGFFLKLAGCLLSAGLWVFFLVLSLGAALLFQDAEAGTAVEAKHLAAALKFLMFSAIAMAASFSFMRWMWL